MTNLGLNFFFYKNNTNNPSAPMSDRSHQCACGDRRPLIVYIGRK